MVRDPQRAVPAPASAAQCRGEQAVLRRATELAGSRDAALSWYDRHPIAGFGGATARDLVADGRYKAVLLHLDNTELGTYA